MTKAQRSELGALEHALGYRDAPGAPAGYETPVDPGAGGD